MAFFEGNKMTGGYGNGPDIIHSCSVTVDRGEIVSILGPNGCLLYTSPSPRDVEESRMPSSA